MMRKSIKRVLVLLLAAVLLVLTLAACGNDPATSDPNSQAEMTTTTTTGGDVTSGTDTTTDAAASGDTTTSGSSATTGAGTAEKTSVQNTSTKVTTSGKVTTTNKTTTPTSGDNFKGTTYYVSSSAGSDWNEGDSEAQAVASLAVASTLGEPGDRVLFKRGDVWRGDILTTRSGVTYGAYGSGNAPAFYGSAQNYADKSKWKQASNARIWYYDGAISRDVGGVVMNNGSAFGVRQENLSAMKGDRNFYYNQNEQRLYLYSRNGNPAEVWNNIEFIERLNLVSLKGDNVTLQNLSIRYADYGIVGGDNKNIAIKNCDFAWIGGCLHNYGNTVRYGNAVELYGGVNGLTVDRCSFSQIFDTAVTVQYIGTADTTIQNVTVSNNTIDKCQWSMEFWLECKNSAGKYIGTIKNIKILNNQLTNAGKGWSANQRWGGGSVGSSCHFMTMSATGYSVSDVLIKNNTFKGGAASLVGISWQNYLPTFEGNTFIQTKGEAFGNMGVDGRLVFDDSIAQKIKKYDPTAKIEFLT